MSWQVGDLAVTADADDACPACWDSPESADAPAKGSILTVKAVVHAMQPCGLVFAGELWCSCGFRKIAPDKHEACEEEFAALLRKEPVGG